MKRKLGFILLLVWLLPGLACNLPKGPNAAVEQSVQATLAALSQQTLPAGINQPIQTTPGSTPQPVPTASDLDVLPAMTPASPGDQISRLEGDFFYYFTLPGDTRQALALRFGIDREEIVDLSEYPPLAMLPVGLEISIRNILYLSETYPILLPDSEVIYSHTSVDFSTEQYVQDAGGFLSTFSEKVDDETLNGSQIVERVAIETSINPRLLLAFLEYRSGWVRGDRAGTWQVDYPIGFYAGDYRGLYKEMILTARQLTIGYYGWRSGKKVTLDFLGGNQARIDPLLNSGSVALQYLFSRLYSPADWEVQLYQPGNFLDLYKEMFGDPWQRAMLAGDVLPVGLSQPILELPFQPGETWSLTGGPHLAWGVGSAWGGLDFAPSDVEPGCTVTRYWATAAASGLVTRSEHGVVALDLDGDGYESTGWVVVYLHIADAERIPAQSRVNVDDRIGHPSCEGGKATGTHVHIARKYNGEWISAGEPLPFVLSGWQAWEADLPYSGTLTRGDRIVTARPDGSHTSLITR